MSEENQGRQAHLIEITSDLVAAYVANNSVPVSALADLISAVHGSLTALGRPAAQRPEPLVPPVPIKKSVTPDYLISLEDGRRYKSLKRHLNTRGLTPEEYRRKWGLPLDYPMVAANYAAQRSQLAKSIGLGRSRTAA
ncbi:MucR family transcriptional regulator [Methylobacterium sp. ID0610]|uniref:MucR family transcriptional regulator n=1 Tax=Methylobacterium carpenticola TaxID=3344827 RepID=UPI0036B648BF